MKRETAINELTSFQNRSDRLQSSLHSSIGHFRKGSDHHGLAALLNSMDDLENLLEFQQNTGFPWKDAAKIVSVLQTLCLQIKNQDVIGLTDVLEFVLYPLTKEWTEEVTVSDYRQEK